jgi:hypothetical protein
LEKVPAGQTEQFVALVSLPYMPGTQAVHMLALALA